MALDDPEPLIGLHLTNLKLAPTLEPAPALSPKRNGATSSRPRDGMGQSADYTAIQSTKP